MPYTRIRFSFALAGALCLAVLGFIHPKAAHAFTISPVVVDVVSESGSSQQGILHITNTNATPETYYVSVQNFIAQGEDGNQEFLPEDQHLGLASWIEPEEKSITVEPMQSKDFRYLVNVPKNAEPGGHYAAIFFSTQPGPKEGESSVGVSAKTGVLFLARIAGDIREEARIESFGVSSNWMTRLPAYFTLRVRNVGNVHFRPEGNIRIKNIFGQVSATTPLNPRRAAVLPNSIRRIEAAWAMTFDMPSGGFMTELKNEWKNFGLGRYTAEVDGYYGAQSTPLHANVTFWVMPWHILIVAGLGLILVIVLFVLYNKMIVRSAMKKMKPPVV